MQKATEVENISVDADKFVHIEYAQASNGWQVAIMRLDNPPVNALSQMLREQLLDGLHIIEAAYADATILVGAERCFVAGGDLGEFDRPAPEPHLPDVVAAIDASPVPFLAAMHGHVLGGGVELALGCAWRMALADTKFGMPEVTVGVIPGAGGTQRLPRLIGYAAAVTMMTSGRPIDAVAARTAGLIDDIVAGDSLEVLIRAALDFLATTPIRGMAISACPLPDYDAGLVAKIRGDLLAKTPLFEAPFAVLDIIEASRDTPFARAMSIERATHLSLRTSKQSRALRHIFHAERHVMTLAGLPKAEEEIHNLVVCGGGLMGCGIAFSAFMVGYHVTVVEQHNEVGAAEARLDKLFEGALVRGKLADDEGTARAERLRVVADINVVCDADLIIEAVFEDLSVKQRLFAELAAIMTPTAILATNTSYLDPREIAAGLACKDRVIGLHFFSPAHIMKLVEIVHSADTAPHVVAQAMCFAKSLGKVGVLSGICDGFIGNRILATYRRQADYCLADGALPDDVDAAMRAFGMPMGPYELQDMVGLQIAWANRQHRAVKRPADERYVDFGDILCTQGRFGLKAGKGWYDYVNGTATADPEVEMLIKSKQGRNLNLGQTDIAARILAVMVNEALLILEEGIAARPLDIDVVQVQGYGFPRWRGGLLHYAADVGFADLHIVMANVCQQSPTSWQVAGLFDKLAAGVVSIELLNAGAAGLGAKLAGDVV